MPNKLFYGVLVFEDMDRHVFVFCLASPDERSAMNEALRSENARKLVERGCDLVHRQIYEVDRDEIAIATRPAVPSFGLN